MCLYDNDDWEENYFGISVLVLPFTRAMVMATYRRQQPFSLPDSIMHYIAKNPSSAKIYQKLAMSCKYFFIKNPLIVVSTLSLQVDYEFDDVIVFGVGKPVWYTKCDGKRLDLSIITSKLWVTEKLSIKSDYDERTQGYLPFTSLPNIYRSDAKECSFMQIDISLKDLVLLASKAEKISFNDGTQVINDDDGIVVALEKIVAALPNLKMLIYVLHDTDSSKIVTAETARELIKIPHFSNLDKFQLCNVPESFDIDCFFGYIKGNKKTEFRLFFDPQNSEEYDDRLEAIVAEIFENEDRDYMVPLIYFS